MYAFRAFPKIHPFWQADPSLIQEDAIVHGSPPGSDCVEWNSDDGDAEVGENQVDQQQMVIRLQLKFPVDLSLFWMISWPNGVILSFL